MRLIAALLAIAMVAVGFGQTIAVGSKKFTESYVLGEIAKKTLTDAGFQVEHKQGMGATAILWEALKGGSISVYPEYTGTVSEELLKIPKASRDTMEKELAKSGIGMGPDLGFNDAYGVAMRREQAQKFGITKISDLAQHPELKCGITHEFALRKDGWQPLCAAYGLKFADFKEIDHSLGYAALFAGQVDIKDCYTTDFEIKKYDLVVLQDDKQFLPLYKAVYLYRLTLPKGAIDALAKLGGTIDDEHMIAMNEEASRTQNYSKAAALYFAKAGKPATGSETDDSFMTKVREELVPELIQHLKLVGVSMLIAVLIGIPLGIWASRPGTLSAFILGGTGVIQTIPSLALLALLVPISFFGISFTTAVTALFLYSLLPIVRNTAAGLRGIPQPLRESAAALGLEPIAQMRKIYLPMALPTILAGIKTSAVINVGTATLAALIGQGGLGQPIVSGLSLNETTPILWGAIPAAVLALLVQGAFDLFERAVVPRGMTIRGSGVEKSS